MAPELRVVAEGFSWLLLLLDMAFVELTLFAAIGFVLGGIDELAVDIIWIAQRFIRRRGVVPPTLWAQAGPPPPQLRYAVMVPAWNESAVIGRMIDTNLAAYRGSDVVLFIGCYPNDPATIGEVSRRAGERVKLVIGPRPGKSTKADCLNNIWHAVQSERAHFDAIILHDAEDIASPHETSVFDRVIARHPVVQLPVVPSRLKHSRWISGHYCDEFAEAHGKTMIVREAIGAGLPLAGVGCAIRIDTLQSLSDRHGGRPFDEDSLTEDYELGLRLSQDEARPVFIRVRVGEKRELVATHADFPADLESAVRQKTRWAVGIGLAGWDRLGWGRGWAENWMRLRDRRGLMSAIVMTAGYSVLVLGTVLIFARVGFGHQPPTLAPELTGLLLMNALFLLWRLCVRAYFVYRTYGLIEALLSIPRTVIGNVIAILSARRSVTAYARMLRTGKISWDKTEHSFSGYPFR
jgi:bacteriophage N4 adsorption protein B